METQHEVPDLRALDAQLEAETLPTLAQQEWHDAVGAYYPYAPPVRDVIDPGPYARNHRGQLQYLVCEVCDPGQADLEGMRRNGATWVPFRHRQSVVVSQGWDRVYE